MINRRRTLDDFAEDERLRARTPNVYTNQESNLNQDIDNELIDSLDDLDLSFDFDSSNENDQNIVFTSPPSTINQLRRADGTPLYRRRLSQNANIEQTHSRFASTGTVELEDINTVNVNLREALYNIGVRSLNDLYKLYTENDENTRNLNLSYIMGLQSNSNYEREGYINAIADIIYAHPKRDAQITKQNIIDELNNINERNFIQERVDDFKAYFKYFGVGNDKDTIVSIQSPGAGYTIDLARELYGSLYDTDVYIDSQSRRTYDRDNQDARKTALKYQVKKFISNSGVINPLGEGVVWNYDNRDIVLRNFISLKPVMKFFNKTNVNQLNQEDYNELGNIIVDLLTSTKIQTDDVFGLKLNDEEMAKKILGSDAVRIGMTSIPNIREVVKKQMIDYFKDIYENERSNEEIERLAEAEINSGRRPHDFNGFILKSGTNIEDNMRLTATAKVKSEDDLDNIIQGISIDPVVGFAPIGFDTSPKLNIPHYNVFIRPSISDANKFKEIMQVEEDNEKYTLTINGRIDEFAKTTLWESKNINAKSSIPLIEQSDNDINALELMSSNFTYGGSLCNKEAPIPKTKEDRDKKLNDALISVYEYFSKYDNTRNSIFQPINDIITDNINMINNFQPAIVSDLYNTKTNPTCEHVEFIQPNEDDINGNTKIVIKKNVNGTNSQVARKLDSIKSKCERRRRGLECVANELIVTQNLTKDYLKSGGADGNLINPLNKKFAKVIEENFEDEKEEREKALKDLLELTLSYISGIPMKESTTNARTGAPSLGNKLSTEEKLNILENADTFNKIKLTLKPLNFDTILNDTVFD